MLGLAFRNVFQIEKFNLAKQNYSLNFVRKNMDLKLVCKRLNEYANLGNACDWDNVGLLVEPSEPLLVKRLFLTNDLTEPVLEEAIKKDINLIVCYHPAIFRPLKKLTQSEWKERSIVKCIEKRIAIFSPHTSWDSINGGINDWILSAFGKFLE